MSCTNLKWDSKVRYLNSNSHFIPESGGIYKVLRNDGVEGELSRVYVGKASSLKNQYLKHLFDSEENECLKNNVQNKECYFKYALLAGEQHRQDAENHLLDNGTYECNARGQ